MENNSIKAIVYLTINTQNNKIYIGVHITNTPYEFDNYYGCGITGTSSYWFKHPKYPFQKACKKYGLNAFKRYTLYVFDSYEEALQKEREIVNENFLKRNDVYNVALGGGSGLILDTEIEVHQYDLNGIFVKTFRSYSDAAKQIGVSCPSIYSAVISNGICCNSYWSETKCSCLDVSNFKKSIKKPVYLYDRGGLFVRDFESISDCAKCLEVRLSSVQKAIKFGSKCGGYYITPAKVEKFDVKKYKRNTNKSVFQYDSNGHFLQEFASIKEARVLLKKPLQRLAQHIQEQTLYEGCYWSYDKQPFINIVPPKKKRIGQYDSQGNLVKIWESYRECAKEFSNLRYVLNGSRSNTKGYCFKYLS